MLSANSAIIKITMHKKTEVFCLKTSVFFEEDSLFVKVNKNGIKIK